MKTATLARMSLKGRALIAVVVAAVLVVVGAGVARASASGDSQGTTAAAASATSDSKVGAPATLEEIIEDAKRTTFYDTDQFLWEHYGMTEREFEQSYGVDDDVLDAYETPRPSSAQGGGTAADGAVPDGSPDGAAFATRQEYEAAKDAWKAAHPGVDDDVWEAQHPSPFDCDDHDHDD